MRTLTQRLARRKKRVSANISGTADKPRISINRSNKFIYAQAIDDVKEVTLAAASSVKAEGTASTTKSDAAKQTGEALGNTLKSLKIEKAVIDRNRFQYLGRVKSLVEGLRAAGIQV